jgi:KDO2-lipid IV(A) lauroyltransferase
MRVLKRGKMTPSLVRSLKGNGLLALLVDRPACGEGVRVRFFGEDIEVPSGPARLALRSGAKIVPAAFARIRPSDPAVAVLTDFTVEHERTGDMNVDIQSVMQAVMGAHERFIRAHPDQWYMFRELWTGRRAPGAVT